MKKQNDAKQAGQAEFRRRADRFMAEALAQRAKLREEYEEMARESKTPAAIADHYAALDRQWAEWQTKRAIFDAWVLFEAELLEKFCRDRGVRGETIATVLARAEVPGAADALARLQARG